MTVPAGPRPTVALLGTGIMGAAMGRSMLRAGLAVRVWNRTSGRATTLENGGAVVAATPADAVQAAQVIVTMLADVDAVLEVMIAAGPNLQTGQTWAQTSTVGVAGLDRLAGFAHQHELGFVDSPVLGTREPAERGALIVLASGPEQLRKRVEPVFDAIGQRTMWLGEAGTASRLKLVVNSWVLALTTAAAEAVGLAQGLKVDPRWFLEVVSGGPLDNSYLHNKAAAMLSGDFSPSFTVEMAWKDARLINAAAQAAGVRMDIATATAERFARTVALGHAGEDMAATYFAS